MTMTQFFLVILTNCPDKTVNIFTFFSPYIDNYYFSCQTHGLFERYFSENKPVSLAFKIYGLGQQSLPLAEPNKILWLQKILDFFPTLFDFLANYKPLVVNTVLKPENFSFFVYVVYFFLVYVVYSFPLWGPFFSELYDFVRTGTYYHLFLFLDQMQLEFDVSNDLPEQPDSSLVSSLAVDVEDLGWSNYESGGPRQEQNNLSIDGSDTVLEDVRQEPNTLFIDGPDTVLEDVRFLPIDPFIDELYIVLEDVRQEPNNPSIDGPDTVLEDVVKLKEGDILPEYIRFLNAEELPQLQQPVVRMGTKALFQESLNEDKKLALNLVFDELEASLKYKGYVLSDLKPPSPKKCKDLVRAILLSHDISADLIRDVEEIFCARVAVTRAEMTDADLITTCTVKVGFIDYDLKKGNKGIIMISFDDIPTIQN